MKLVSKKLLAILGLGLSLSSALLADDVKITPRHWSFLNIGLVPIQSGGRAKPLDTFARDVSLYVTGSKKFHGWEPIDLLLSWIAFPQEWQTQQFIRVTREDVRRQLGLDESRTFYSPQELFKNAILLQYAERMGGGAPAGSSPPGAPATHPREQELKAVLDRMGMFHSIVSGHGWPVVPKPAPAAWTSLADTDREGELIRKEFVEVLKAYQSGDSEQFERSTELFRASVEGEIPEYQEKLKNPMMAESIYNRFRPFFFAWVFYLISALLWITHSLFSQAGSKRLKGFALATVALAAGSQIFGIALRCFIAGRPPVTNMYESVIWVSLGVVGFAAILYAIHRQGVIFAVACTLATLGLIAGDAAPAILDASINPLVPVLRSNYWLTIHVLTITLGYAAFALTLGLANISLYHFIKGSKGQKVASLNQLTYRATQFGVVLIAAGTILGGIWADYSWGRFWGWDPKEVWALITLLAYLVILHGRYTSWMGQFGFAAWSAVAFMTVVMAWYGVNFILGVGLHSYGFASGGTPWVGGFVGAELLYIIAAAVVYFRRKHKSRVTRAESNTGTPATV
jgi:cytochrome c-type biogenesis protein CcsB